MKRWATAAAVLTAVALIAAVDLGALFADAGPGFRPRVYLLASAVVCFDLIDLLARAFFRHRHTPPTAAGVLSATSVPLDIGTFTPYQMRLHLRPWAFIASVHNLGGELDALLDGLEPFRKHLWVIDDESTDDTVDRLARAEVDHVRGERNMLKPGALRELLRQLPAEIETVVVVDPDVRLRSRSTDDINDLERVLFEFQRSGMAALCPRLQIRPDGWLAGFQELEYHVAFSLGRMSMADHSITSGIAIYRRTDLEAALEAHSLSVYAEDLENAILIQARGGGIYYDGRLVFETEGKRTLPGWFSQRVGWAHGLLKVVTERFAELRSVASRRAVLVYQYFFYIGLLTILLHPLKLVGLALLAASALNGVDAILGTAAIPDGPLNHPAYFSLIYAKYLVVMLAGVVLAVPRGQRMRLLPLAPLYLFYALGHLVPVTVGYLNLVGQRLVGRKLYHDHYDNSPAGHGRRTAR